MLRIQDSASSKSPMFHGRLTLKSRLQTLALNEYSSHIPISHHARRYLLVPGHYPRAISNTLIVRRFNAIDVKKAAISGFNLTQILISSNTLAGHPLRNHSTSLKRDAERNADPITLSEFETGLRSILRARAPDRLRGWKIGIAVSGGVDSMALAALCVGLEQSRNQPYSFEAFIVNHGARKGSSTEAEAVAEVLKERGLKATILTIKWAPNEEPSLRPNFESIARTKRYQALGSACRKSGISNLLLAHHADDQAETVMLRLIGGHRGKGLAAMASAGDIPECNGMYGVNKSGRPILDHSLAPQKVSARKPYKPIALESGGVRIYRPLLGFEKRRLVATCLSMGIRWFEDATNSDVTLTQRNAARSLLTHERLPRAIQRDSLVQLSLVVRQTIQSAERMLHWFRCSIVFFDTRSGRLCMRFPVQQISNNGSATTTTTTPPITNQDIAFVINAVQMVSPMSHLELSKAASIVPRLIRPIKNTSNYAEIENTSGDALSGSAETLSMCNVRFDRQVSPLVVKKASSETVDRAPVLDPHYVWILSRARFYRNVPAPIISIAPTISSASSPSSPSSISIMVTDNACPPSASQHQNEERGPRYRHHYQLWDGRFWIWVRNHTLQTLVIRAYRESDAHPLRRSFSAPRSSASSFSSSSSSTSSSSSSSSSSPSSSSSSTSSNMAAAADLLHDFDTMISDAAPGPSRWTLPVIATEDSGKGSGNGSGEGRGGTVLAFPSLGYICPAGKDLDFGFNVRYRSVRLDPPLVGSR